MVLDDAAKMATFLRALKGDKVLANILLGESLANRTGISTYKYSEATIKDLDRLIYAQVGPHMQAIEDLDENPLAIVNLMDLFAPDSKAVRDLYTYSVDITRTPDGIELLAMRIRACFNGLGIAMVNGSLLQSTLEPGKVTNGTLASRIGDPKNPLNPRNINITHIDEPLPMDGTQIGAPMLRKYRITLAALEDAVHAMVLQIKQMFENLAIIYPFLRGCWDEAEVILGRMQEISEAEQLDMVKCLLRKAHGKYMATHVVVFAVLVKELMPAGNRQQAVARGLFRDLADSQFSAANQMVLHSIMHSKLLRLKEIERLAMKSALDSGELQIQIRTVIAAWWDYLQNHPSNNNGTLLLCFADSEAPHMLNQDETAVREKLMNLVLASKTITMAPDTVGQFAAALTQPPLVGSKWERQELPMQKQIQLQDASLKKQPCPALGNCMQKLSCTGWHPQQQWLVWLAAAPHSSLASIPWWQRKYIFNHNKKVGEGEKPFGLGHIGPSPSHSSGSGRGSGGGGRGRGRGNGRGRGRGNYGRGSRSTQIRGTVIRS